MYFCLKSSIGTQGSRLAVKALNNPAVYSTDHSKAVVPVLVLFFFVALGFILRGYFCMPYLMLFCSCVFQSF